MTSAQRRFVYYRCGNRTSVYDATSGVNQIQSVSLVQSSSITNNQIASVTQGGTTYTYSNDANGNLTINTPFRLLLTSVLIWYYNGAVGVKRNVSPAFARLLVSGSWGNEGVGVFGSKGVRV